MKITKKKLIELIKETIYVDPKGVAVRDINVPDSVYRKDKRVSQTPHAGVQDLMQGSPKEQAMARELAMSGLFPDNEDLDYHGAEYMYIEDPEEFMDRIGGNKYSIIIFGMNCTYENSEIDEDIIAQALEDEGLIYGILPKGSLPGENYNVQYVFGDNNTFNNDPDNYLDNLIKYRLDSEYSSDGYNRPCGHELYQHRVIDLGFPVTHSRLFNDIVINNSLNLNKRELHAVDIALAKNNANNLESLGYSDQGYGEHVVSSLVINFMAIAAQKVLGLTTNTIVDDTMHMYPDYVLIPGSVL